MIELLATLCVKLATWCRDEDSVIDYNHPSIEQTVIDTVEGGLGVDSMIRAVRRLPIAAAWSIWSTPEKQSFNRALISRYCDFSSARYAEERLGQLRQGGFELWVFHHDPGACEERFAELDGVAVAPGSPFWSEFYPPHIPGCQCHVSGAFGPAGVRRLGGDPDKCLPEWATGG